MDDRNADQAKRADTNPLCRHVEHVGAKCQSTDQDEVTDQIDSERHLYILTKVSAHGGKRVKVTTRRGTNHGVAMIAPRRLPASASAVIEAAAAAEEKNEYEDDQDGLHGASLRALGVP